MTQPALSSGAWCTRQSPTYLVNGVVTVLSVDECIEDIEVAIRLPLPLRPPPIYGRDAEVRFYQKRKKKPSRL